MTGSLFPRKIPPHPNIPHPFLAMPREKANYERNAEFFGLLVKVAVAGVCSSPVCWFTTLDYRLDSATKDESGKKSRTNWGSFLPPPGVILSYC